MTTPPDRAKAAYEHYLQAQADADQARELGKEIGTPAGDRTHELDVAAYDAYERYLHVWREAQGHPRTELDAGTRAGGRTVTGPADRSQQAGPGEPAATDSAFPYQFSGQPEAPDTWTADAAYPADSPVPYTLTAKAETVLGEVGSPTPLLPNTQACDMRTRPPQARPGLPGPADAYVTEVSAPRFDSGIHRLHARMKEPEPDPEAGL